ncbi:response regulator [Chitinophaga solisilvae]|uniref:Response regulator n=1 Tax=Chitinophaga solisilvae TaxID=1233460 RepID=A0A3S1D0V6_9BACT|nr:response regulator [Chitinophaga solisilvae]NSL87347.1 response regulator [Chitinophaga solisilvae]
MKPQTVLVIDDDADDRTFFSEAMKTISPEIHTHLCESGTEAIDLLFNKKIISPDFIFLDLNMPAMNGRECLQELRKIIHRGLTKIIVMSTSDLVEDMQDSINLGARLFVTKPDSFEALCNILKDVLEEKWQKYFLR